MIRHFRAIALLFVVLSMPPTAIAQGKPTASSPIGSMASWFPQDNYPAEAKRAGEQGRVIVRVSLDATGRPVGCAVVESSGSTSLDARTCELAVANGRFNPALNARGEGIQSTYTIPAVRWELQDNPPIKLAGPWRVAATMRIDRAGKVASCTEQRLGPVPAQYQMCVAARQMPTGFGMFARGDATAASIDLVMETSLGLDDVPALPMTFESGDRETLEMSVIHLDIGLDGIAGNCRVVAQSGLSAGDPCAGDADRFLPIDRPRGVTVKTAISRPIVR